MDRALLRVDANLVMREHTRVRARVRTHLQAK